MTFWEGGMHQQTLSMAILVLIAGFKIVQCMKIANQMTALHVFLVILVVILQLVLLVTLLAFQHVLVLIHVYLMKTVLVVVDINFYGRELKNNSLPFYIVI